MILWDGLKLNGLHSVISSFLSGRKFLIAVLLLTLLCFALLAQANTRAAAQALKADGFRCLGAKKKLKYSEG
jgi:hypothetical protein